MCFSYSYSPVLHNDAGNLPWLPSLTLMLSIVISFFTAESTRYLPTLICGTYISWIYSDTGRRNKKQSLEVIQVMTLHSLRSFLNLLRPVINLTASIYDRMLCGRSETSDEGRGTGWWHIAWF